MKKLSEIKLNDFYEMDEMEMRNIVGGSGSCDDGSGSGQCAFKCNDVTVRWLDKCPETASGANSLQLCNEGEYMTCAC